MQFSNFANINVDDLVKGLTVADAEKSQTAIEKADAYLQSVETTGFDRTLLNTTNEPSNCPKNNVCFIRVY